VYPWAAIIIGLVAGALYCLGSRASIFLKARPARRLRSARGVFALPYGVVQSVVR
jgi:hypothetical protein